MYDTKKHASETEKELLQLFVRCCDFFFFFTFARGFFFYIILDGLNIENLQLVSAYWLYGYYD